MSKQQKEGLSKGLLGLGFIYLLLVIFVPMFTPTPGVDPEVLTGAEKFVKFFADNQLFFKDNGITILIALGIVLFGGKYLLKKK